MESAYLGSFVRLKWVGEDCGGTCHNTCRLTTRKLLAQRSPSDGVVRLSFTYPRRTRFGSSLIIHPSSSGHSHRVPVSLLPSTCSYFTRSRVPQVSSRRDAAQKQRSIFPQLASTMPRCPIRLVLRHHMTTLILHYSLAHGVQCSPPLPDSIW